MFSRTWMLPTLLVVLGAILCIRLGIWQLDRLEQRRNFNQQVTTMKDLPSLKLDKDAQGSLKPMEWRSVSAGGSYDFTNQIAIRNQYFNGQLGYHLITPLIVSSSNVVLVDRGWIPFSENPSRTDWMQYDEPGVVTVTGQIRTGASKPAFGGLEDPIVDNETKQLIVWNNLDLEKIEKQLPFPIMDIYIQQDQNESDLTPPIPDQPELELTEGPHLGYALQWFTFAIILCIGYPIYVRKQETPR
jgi:surfeit locus 1 family protein